MYQDDFYKPDAEIPINSKTGLQDWDCPEAFDLKYMHQVIQSIKATRDVPSSFVSKEETNTLGESTVSDSQLQHIEKKFESNETVKNTLYVIIDGIMLYHDPELLIPYLDLAIFLRSPYETLKKRREARAGYVTLDGFWKDPPGYFDDMVWPGYVKAYSYLFEKNSANPDMTHKEEIERFDTAPLTEVAKNEYKIQIPKNNDWSMYQMLDWATDLIQKSS